MDPNSQAIPRALYRSLIGSPVLVGDLPEATTFPQQDLKLPDKNSPLPPVELDQKLGHLYEDALAALLGSPATTRYELLARNLQIQEDAHTTLGELDFLLRDKGSDSQSDRLIHLELATKFYLAVETDSGLLLPGPDARDNYFRKIDRLRSHQLQLPKLHREHLPEDYRDREIVSQHLIHGCLFDHIACQEKLASPEFANPACRRGRWLRIGELDEHFPPGSSTFHLIPKALWPVPFEILDEEKISLETWPSESEIDAPSQLDRCTMIRASGEPDPYFVTPEHYPRPRP